MYQNQTSQYSLTGKDYELYLEINKINHEKTYTQEDVIEKLNEKLLDFFKNKIDYLNLKATKKNKKEIDKTSTEIDIITAPLRNLLYNLYELEHHDKLLLLAKNLYKNLHRSLQAIQESTIATHEKTKIVNILNAPLFDVNVLHIQVSTKRSEFSKALAYLNESLELSYSIEYHCSEEIYILRSALYCFLANVQLKQGDYYSAKKNIEIVDKIYKDYSLSNKAFDYFEVCIGLGNHYRVNNDYWQAYVYYKKAIDCEKIFINQCNEVKKISIIKSINKTMEEKHKNEFINLINTYSSENYKLKLEGEKIVVTMLKPANLRKLKFKGEMDLKQKEIKIDIFSLSLNTFTTNLKSIDKACQLQATKESYEQTFEVTTVNSANSQIVINPLKQEITNSEKQEVQESPIKQKKKNHHKSSNNKFFQPAPTETNSDKNLAKELGLPEQYYNRKIIPLSNKHIPEGTYYAIFSRKIAEDMKIDHEILNQHQKIVERGEIGNGIKFNKKDEHFPLKTWVPTHTKFGDFRMWGEVVATIPTKDDRVIKLVDFKHPHNHKTQKKMYK